MDGFNKSTQQEQINTSIQYNSFSEDTLHLIDNYINDIMEEQMFINSIYRSMQDSALQVRRSLGRMPYATTHEQALRQAEMLRQAKENRQIGR